MTSEGGFEKPPTAQEAVLAEVRRSLLDGTLAPGTRINVDGMATQLNVSRAPVRDALRILEGEGQVQYRPHRGYSVPELDPDDLLQIYRLRELLETEALLLGAGRFNEQLADVMREAAAEVTEAVGRGDKVAGTYANRRFHFAMFETCGEARLISEIKGLWNSDVYRTNYFADPDMTAESDQEHYSIIEAVAAGDVDRIVELSNHHRAHALRMVLSVLEKNGELPPNLDPVAEDWRPRLTARDRV